MNQRLRLYLHTRRREGSTLIELMTVIVIIAILLAIAAPYIIGDLKRSQDSGSKNNLSLAYRILKRSEVTSTAAQCSPQTPPCFLSTSQEAQQLQNALPLLKVQAGLPLQNQAQVNVIGVETDGSGEAVVCTKSASGNFFSIRVVLTGTTQGVYYGEGDSCTDGSNPATPGIPYNTNNGPDPNPPGQGTNESPGTDWTGNNGGTGDCNTNNTCTVAPPVNLTLPRISGNPGDVPGNTLNVSNGSWDPHYPVASFAYQWQRNGVAIVGATSNSYIVTTSDMNQLLTVTVTATGVNGGTASATSPNFLVANPPANNGGSNLPVISDTQGNNPPQEQDVLTVSNGTWTGTPPFSYSYQWQRCQGGSCSNIAAATSSSYTVQHVDIGYSIDAVVTNTNSAGTVSATSRQTAIVNGAPPGNTNGGSSGGGSCPGSPGCDSASGSGGSVVTPVNQTSPAASGSAVVGQTMVGSYGSWSGPPTGYGDQWLRCNSSGASCVAISGATSQVYTITSADLGSTIRFQVTASNSSGTATSQSSATAVVTNGVPTVAPSNTVPPSVNGSPIVGNTLWVNPGTWANGPATYSYQWERCDATGNSCVPIAGATDPAYQMTAADQGMTIKVQVTATNAAGSNTVTSSASGSVAPTDPSKNYPANTALPSISGVDAQGSSLSGDVGAWTNFPTGWSYQWERCNASGASCTSIVGATSSTYLLTSDDVGNTIRFVVVASNSDGNGYAVSAATALIGGTGNQTVTAPANTGAPSISGTTTQGYVLSGSLGTWTGTNPSLLPQWRRCDLSGANCVDIPGANGVTYLLGAADVNHTLVFQVIGSNSAGTVIANSAPSATIAAGSSGGCGGCGGTSNPVISDPSNNPPRVGDTFSTTTGSWAGSGPFSYSYQWQRCNGSVCSGTAVDPTSGATIQLGPISGATSSTYTLQIPDSNFTVSACVTASNTYGGGIACSTASGVVQDYPKNAGGSALPTVGTPNPPVWGSVSTATNGTWTGTPTVTFTYQWVRCDNTGSTCSGSATDSLGSSVPLGPIAGATSQSYTPGDSDVGLTLKITVTGHNAVPVNQSSATSTASSVVRPAPPTNTVAPTITGTATAAQTLSVSSNGSWNPNGAPVSYSYQWQHCSPSCANIGSATASSYQVSEAYTGQTIQVAVTATNWGGSTAANSNQLGAISGYTPSGLSVSGSTGSLPSGQTSGSASGSVSDIGAASTTWWLYFSTGNPPSSGGWSGTFTANPGSVTTSGSTGSFSGGGGYNTTYYYRLCAQNAYSGQVCSGTNSFTTSAPPDCDNDYNGSNCTANVSASSTPDWDSGAPEDGGGTFCPGNDGDDTNIAHIDCLGGLWYETNSSACNINNTNRGWTCLSWTSSSADGDGTNAVQYCNDNVWGDTAPGGGPLEAGWQGTFTVTCYVVGGGSSTSISAPGDGT